MSLSIKAIIRQDADNLSELLSAALISNTPPLSAAALQKITAVIEHRLSSLDGVDRYSAQSAFDIVSTIPPLEGARFGRLLARLIGTDFSESTIEKAFSHIADPPGGPADQATDDFGFMHVPAEMRRLGRPTATNEPDLSQRPEADEQSAGGTRSAQPESSDGNGQDINSTISATGRSEEELFLPKVPLIIDQHSLSRDALPICVELLVMLTQMESTLRDQLLSDCLQIFEFRLNLDLSGC